MSDHAASLGSVGEFSAAWRARKHYSSSPEHLVAKLAEEVGEVARAVIGDIEHRPGRGDARQEAAQVVILLATLIHLHYPGPDLFAAVHAEMVAAGAMPDNPPSPGPDA